MRRCTKPSSEASNWAHDCLDPSIIMQIRRDQTNVLQHPRQKKKNGHGAVRDNSGWLRSNYVSCQQKVTGQCSASFLRVPLSLALSPPLPSFPSLPLVTSWRMRCMQVLSGIWHGVLATVVSMPKQMRLFVECFVIPVGWGCAKWCAEHIEENNVTGIFRGVWEEEMSDILVKKIET